MLGRSRCCGERPREHLHNKTEIEFRETFVIDRSDWPIRLVCHEFGGSGVRAKIAVLASAVLCANATAEPAHYAVDGLAVEMQLNFDDVSYHKYRCSPSNQFDGLTWCQKKQRGSSAIYSLLHSPDGSVLYINRAQEGGVSNSKQAQNLIQQYSLALGESPQLIRMPRRTGISDGLIAVWGKVRLEQLDQDNVKTLKDRKDLKKGLLIDYLGNFARSAKAGLPIYRIDGGPGLVWAASFGQKGRGIVRLAAVDLSKFAAPALQQQPVNQSETSSKVSEAPQPELSIVAEKVQPEVTDVATTTVELETYKAAPEQDQIEPTKDEKANIEEEPALHLESPGAAVSASWEPVSYKAIVGLLLAVMLASIACIYMRRQKVPGSHRQALQPRTNPFELSARPVVGHALSPDRALAKIEEIRRSLLDLAAAPSLVPSAIPEEPILPSMPADPRPNQSFEHDLDDVLLREVWKAVQR